MAALSDKDANSRWVLKSHKKISFEFPRSRFIATRRDPRDVLMSQMRFAEIGFEGALKAAIHYTGVADYYARFPETIRLEVAYADIIDNPETVADRIAAFLNLEPGEEIRTAIPEKLSKEQVSNLIDRLDAESEQGQNAPDAAAVLRVDANARMYDVRTGFQSGHVSDYRDGDWRRILPADQQAQMNERLGSWLARNGYD
jgi:hypothetical protein